MREQGRACSLKPCSGRRVSQARTRPQFSNQSTNHKMPHAGCSTPPSWLMAATCLSVLCMKQARASEPAEPHGHCKGTRALALR